jgi:signal transduction histidine kinase
MGTSMRVMRHGQHVIAAVLVVIGTVRALADHAALVPVVAGAVCFALWYCTGAVLVQRTGAKHFPAVWVGGLALIWLVLIVISPEFIWVAFLLWLIAGYLLALWPAIAFSVLVLAAVIGVPLLQSGHTSYAFVIGPLVGGIFAFGIARGYLQLLGDVRERQRLIASLVQAQNEMAGLHEELARTQRESGVLEERTRLSRDIHDTIAQGFSAIVLLARAARSTPGADAMAGLEQIESTAVDNLVEVRRIVSALAPAELSEGALPGAIRRMLERLSSEAGIGTELHADASIPALPATVEVALLRTAQSALANVRLHSGAHRVVVSLVDDGDEVRLDVVDDGRGFDAASWHPGPDLDAATGYGLPSMRARLRELGGGLDVESTVGKGTALSAHVPFGRPHRGSEEAG